MNEEKKKNLSELAELILINPVQQTTEVFRERMARRDEMEDFMLSRYYNLQKMVQQKSE